MIYNIFYSLYTITGSLVKDLNVTLTPGGYLLGLLVASIFSLAAFAVYYTFRSIGLYKMAKNSGINKPYLAIIPFVGLYVCYKLSPNSKYVKKQPVFCILAIICGAIVLLVNVLLDAFYGIPAIFKLVDLNKQMMATSTTFVVPSSVFGFDKTISTILSGYLTLVNLAYAIFALFVYSRLFMSYSFKSTKLVLFSALVYYFMGTFLLAGIFIFAFRNKPRINYDAYIEARRQWNPYTPYGGNPYGGNPYNNGQNSGYNQQNPNGYNYGQQREIDPFEEFNSSNNNKQDDSDDFFN